jgi:hypothetical protein
VCRTFELCLCALCVLRTLLPQCRQSLVRRPWGLALAVLALADLALADYRIIALRHAVLGLGSLD